MFVVVTVICLLLGYQAYVVRQRAEVLKWLEDKGTHFPERLDPQWVNDNVGRWCIFIDDSELPWYRRLFGDHRLKGAYHPFNATPYEINRVKSAFPEASVSFWPI